MREPDRDYSLGDRLNLLRNKFRSEEQLRDLIKEGPAINGVGKYYHKPIKFNQNETFESFYNNNRAIKKLGDNLGTLEKYSGLKLGSKDKLRSAYLGILNKHDLYKVSEGTLSKKDYLKRKLERELNNKDMKVIRQREFGKIDRGLVRLRNANPFSKGGTIKRAKKAKEAKEELERYRESVIKEAGGRTPKTIVEHHYYYPEAPAVTKEAESFLSRNAKIGLGVGAAALGTGIGGYYLGHRRDE